MISLNKKKFKFNKISFLYTSLSCWLLPALYWVLHQSKKVEVREKLPTWCEIYDTHKIIVRCVSAHYIVVFVLCTRSIHTQQTYFTPTMAAILCVFNVGVLFHCLYHFLRVHLLLMWPCLRCLPDTIVSFILGWIPLLSFSFDAWKNFSFSIQTFGMIYYKQVLLYCVLCDIHKTRRASLIHSMSIFILYVCYLHRCIIFAGMVQDYYKRFFIRCD